MGRRCDSGDPSCAPADRGRRRFSKISSVKAGGGMAYRPGTNTGHGHVWPRPDGVRARCGGAGICSECAKDLASQQHFLEMETRQRERFEEEVWSAHKWLDDQNIP